MNKMFWIVGAVLVLVIGATLFVRNGNSIKTTSEDYSEIASSKPSNKSSPNSSMGQTSIGRMESKLDEEDVEFSQELVETADMNMEVLEAYEQTNNPLMQEGRLVAEMTANMSDAQMLELQKSRQGTVVRSSGGELSSPYVEREKCSENTDCTTVVFNAKTEKIIWDGQWGNGYAETGVGLEVVEMKRSTQ